MEICLELKTLHGFMKFCQKLKKADGCFVEQKLLLTEMEKRNNIFNIKAWAIEYICLFIIARFNLISKKLYWFPKYLVLVVLYIPNFKQYSLTAFYSQKTLPLFCLIVTWHCMIKIFILLIIGNKLYLDSNLYHCNFALVKK